ncbi:MAG TPA: isoamylase early set domain-containing protein [Gemmatimonadaceae bacterium]
MHDETDETITRITAALRQPPAVDPTHKARVLVAVAAERERAREARMRAARWWRLAGSMGVTAAAVVALMVWRQKVVDSGRSATRANAQTVAASAPASASTAKPAPSATRHLAASDAAGVAPLPVQLVLRAPAAHRVSVVGDFNGWDAHATTLERDPASGLWSGTVALLPGRHVYAFIVDDSIWMRDPRMPQSRDADFGRPGSVLLVGQP